nr:transposase, mutator type [Tanacetum cinerariifolium]
MVYVCLGALKQGFRACGREFLGLDGYFMSGLWPGQILTVVGVDANNRIYLVAYVIVDAESKASWCWFLNLIREDLGIEANFNYTFISDRQKEELTKIPCKHDVATIYNMSKNSVGVGIPEQWVHVAYRLETWAHVYSFKVNPCIGKDMWPVVESKTVIIPPLYKPLICKPPKKRKKSNDEIASQSALSCKLSRKGNSVSYDKCGNVGHKMKGYKGQGGGFSQAGERKVSGQAAGVKKVFGEAAGETNVSG